MSTMSNEQALEDVEQYEGEGARIINDWYSKSEYMKRRHTFLSRHPQFKHVAKLAPTALRDAALIFPTSEETSTFSVQEVRRRELMHEIVPLLPYPTSDNMETIDGFASYPEEEWQPGDAVEPALLRPGTGAGFDSPELEPEMPPSQPLDDPSQPESPVVTTNDSGTNESGSSNPVQSSNDDESAPRPPNSEDAPAEDTSSNAPIIQGWTPASSLAGRSVHVPVKPQRGKKRRSPSEGEDEQVVADTDDAVASPFQDKVEENGPKTNAEPEEPRRKRVKFNLKQSRSNTPDSAATEQTKEPSSRRKTSTTRTSATAKKGTKSSSRSKRTASTSSQEPPSKTSSRSKRATSAPSADARTTTVERIARGEILPKTAALAIQAVAHRLSRFRDHHFENSKAHHPDFPPEFFDRANFSRVGDIVRCICGATHDDGAEREWIGCDTEGCAVWQHQECIKEAMPDDLDDDYLCHMCDPFTHRRELQRIRRKHGMP